MTIADILKEAKEAVARMDLIPDPKERIALIDILLQLRFKEISALYCEVNYLRRLRAENEALLDNAADK